MAKRLNLFTLALSASLVSLAALSAATNPAGAAPEAKFYNDWIAQYPTSPTGPNVVSGAGTSCQLCHVNKFGGKNYNAYGKKMYDLMKSGSSAAAAIQGCETFDSDGDPFGLTNLAEINAGVQPGWTGGPNNTTYDNSGVLGVNQSPPAAILGTFDLCDGAAMESVRLGTPPNPNALLPGVTSGPIVGQVWDPVVDHSSFLPTAILDIMIVAGGPPLNLPVSWGTLLISPSGLTVTRLAGNPFNLPIPLDCSFVGLGVSAQVGSVSAVDIKLTNALDIVIGTY